MRDGPSYRSIADIERHTCGDRCVCPVHNTPMWYSATEHLHACQDPECVHAGGVDLDRHAYEAVLASDAFRRICPPDLRHEFWPPREDS